MNVATLRCLAAASVLVSAFVFGVLGTCAYAADFPQTNDDVDNGGGTPADVQSQLRKVLGPPSDGVQSLREARDVGARACGARGSFTLVALQSARLRAPIIYYGGHSVEGGPAAATRYELAALPWEYAMDAVATCQAAVSANAATAYLTIERRERRWRVIHDDTSFDTATRFAQGRESDALASIEGDVPPRP